MGENPYLCRGAEFKRKANNLAKKQPAAKKKQAAAKKKQPAAPTEQWMAEGFARHKAGQWTEAEAHYRRVLAQQGGHARAAYLLGSLLAQQGRWAEAVAWLTKSLQAQPAHAQALSHRGVALKGLGRVQEALADYNAALALRPDYPEALSNRGAVLQKLERWDEAEADYQAALALRPGWAEAWGSLGLIYRQMERWDDARAAFEQVLVYEPGSQDAGNNLGLVLLKQGDFAGALGQFEAVLSASAGCVPALNNRGMALKELGRVDEALSCLAEVLALQPDYNEAQVNLGTCLMAQNRMEEALAATDLALARDPEHAGAHWNRSLVLLTLGDYAQGWPEYEWRFGCHMAAPRLWSTPRWDGTPLAGRTLLVCAEQGLGDTLQFVRCCAAINKSCAAINKDGQRGERSGRVVLECPPALHSLVQDCRGIDQVVAPPASHEPARAHDVHISLLSLPGLLGIAPGGDGVPYLHAPALGVQKWQAALRPLAPAPHPPLKVGLVWAGNPSHKNDHNRSCRLRDWACLADVPHAAFYSLQKGFAEAELADTSLAWKPAALGAALEDFADTASAMQAMDLIIAVDTSSAHLAGALGRPVWTLLPFTPDWRWGLEREETPWYPSMRLFRQPAPGQWGAVLARVRAELAALALSHQALAQTLDDWEQNPPPDMKQRLQTLAQQHPHAARVWNNLGVLHWQDGEALPALQMFGQALRCDPADDATRLNCADIFDLIGQHDEACALRVGALAAETSLPQKAA